MAQAPTEPVQLWTTKAEREKYENFADLFAIIKTVEKLEKARARACGALVRLPSSPSLAHATRRAGVRARRGAAGRVRGGVPGPDRQVQDASHGAARRRRAGR
jgi:hypothetical protein